MKQEELTVSLGRKTSLQCQPFPEDIFVRNIYQSKSVHYLIRI